MERETRRKFPHSSFSLAHIKHRPARAIKRFVRA
jgi:hypothetical protein